MTGQILEVSTDNKHLSAEDGFLIISEKQTELARLPIDQIEAVIVAAHGITYTNNFLVRLSEYNIPFVLCNQKHFPVSFLLPLEGHYKQGSVIDAQISASLPMNKRLWQELIKAKIAMQLSVLKYYDKPHQRLVYLQQNVKSGDCENAEAQAARFYWQALFGSDFIRDRNTNGINAMLNYGYTILRSFVARYLVAAGLLPSIGIHHKNMLNAFRLADDVMEPFRPIVDGLVYHLWKLGHLELDMQVKRKLVALFSENLPNHLGKTQMSVCIQFLCTSLAKFYLKEKEKLDLPYPLQSADWNKINASK